MLRTGCLGSKWLEGREIAIKLPCGRFPHHPPLPRGSERGEGGCSLCRWSWCYGGGCAGQAVVNGAPTIGLVQHVGWLDPVGRHGDGLAAHKELSDFRERTS
jgi:hypothetical protein